MANTDELLKRVRAENARKDEPRDPADFYTRILVSRQRRSLLVFGVLVFAAFAYTVLARDVGTDRHWLLTALPLIGGGLILAMLPPSEAWDYRPWQTQARQYEKHQAERR